MIIYINSRIPLSEDVLPINAFDIRLYEEKGCHAAFPPRRWSNYCLAWQLENPSTHVDPVKFQFLCCLVTKLIIHDRNKTRNLTESITAMINEIDIPPSIKPHLKQLVNAIPVRQCVTQSPLNVSVKDAPPPVRDEIFLRGGGD